MTDVMLTNLMKSYSCFCLFSY